jgi:putative transposase
MPSVEHVTKRWANNRAENSHQPTRERERKRRKFKSVGEAQRFLSTHSAIYGFFHPGRNLCSAPVYHELLRRKFAEWNEIEPSLIPQGNKRAGSGNAYLCTANAGFPHQNEVKLTPPTSAQSPVQPSM